MILIIDDDASVCTSLALLLKQAGYASCWVQTPQEALFRLASHKIELVLQDMNFSRQTSGDEGLALLQSIRATAPSTSRDPDDRLGLD